MTGGALGSLFAQAFHLSAAERKTLLVAGAAAGMAAIFATPLAAVLLAVELLLFEWKPRSFIPVAAAAAVAAAVRVPLLGAGPDLPGHRRIGAGLAELLIALAVGIAAGLRVGRADAGWCTPSRTSSPSCRSTTCGGRSSADCSSASAAWSTRARSAWATTRSATSSTATRRRLPAGPGDRQGGDLGHRARLGHVGRRAGAAPHHGRRAGRARGPLDSCGRHRDSGRCSAWPRSWAAPCARRSRRWPSCWS